MKKFLQTFTFVLLLLTSSLTTYAQGWAEIAKQLPTPRSEAATNHYFGFAVAIDGNYAVVGAYGTNNSIGAAYVLFYDGSNWVKQAELTASDGAASDQFGYSVSISGDNIVVGAYQNDDINSNSGSAYLFRSDAPEIDVVGNAISLTDGQTTISTTDDTDFGTVAECGTKTVTHSYTINNTGTVVLNISSISSSHADFTIVGAPTTVAASSSATFDVVFDPSSIATITATITINNDDIDENPYTFNVEGVGVASTTDIVRGSALDFDDLNDKVVVGHNPYLDFNQNSQFSLESWIEWRGNFGVLFSKMFDTAPFAGYEVFIDDFGFVYVYLISTHGSNYIYLKTTTTLTSNNWRHIAVTYDGSKNVAGVNIYFDGILQPKTIISNTLSASIQTTAPFVIGARNGVQTIYFLDGKLDESRVWNIARTEEQIRENMHLTLSGCETGLVAYYQMNEISGTGILPDISGNGLNGTLTNMDPATDWVASSVNVGNDVNSTNSESVSIAAIPVGTSTQNFTAANATMRFFQHSGVEDITVTYQEFTPNAIGGVDGINIIQNPMWTVNKSTATETMVVDYTFTFAGGVLTSPSPDKYGLYWRAMNADGAWTKISTASAVTGTTATFGKISLAGQFMVVQESEDDISDVRGNMYNFDGVDDYIQTTGVNYNFNGNFSVECWGKRTSTTTDDWFFGTDAGGGANRSLFVGFRSGNTFAFAFFGNDLNYIVGTLNMTQ